MVDEQEMLFYRAHYEKCIVLKEIQTVKNLLMTTNENNTIHQEVVLQVNDL